MSASAGLANSLALRSVYKYWLSRRVPRAGVTYETAPIHAARILTSTRVQWKLQDDDVAKFLLDTAKRAVCFSLGDGYLF